MPNNIGFHNIPATLRLPLFWAEVDPSMANSNTQNQRSLVIGQVLPTGAIYSTATTSALTNAGPTLTFTTVPLTVQPGQIVQGTGIPVGTTVVSATGTVVTVSGPVTVASGAAIIFANLTPQLVSSATIAVQQFGGGSMLADMVGKYRQNDTFGELWALPLLDDPAAVAAVWTITVAGTPTVNGVIPLYVNGVLLQVAVTTAMASTAIATALATAINSAVDPYTGSPISVTANTPPASVVTVTARNGGVAGNSNDIRFAYLGASAGEVIPSGITLTVAQTVVGAGNPSTLLNTLLIALMDQPYDFIAMPYTDTASTTASTAFMNDTVGRWSWQRQDYGHVFSAAQGIVSALQTLGTTGPGLNDQHLSIMGYNSSPSPSWHWAAAFAGASANSLRADPGLPLHTVPLLGIYAPPQASRFQQTDRNTLAFSGISTFTVAAGGQVQIEMDITTYQKNAYGVADDSYLKIETMFLLMAVLRYMRSGVTTVMARKKLADDGTRVSPGSNVVTPVIIKGYLITLFQQMYNLGWVQNPADFATNIIVQRNALNPNRVDVLWPGQLINQLDVFALLAQFRLASSSYNVQLAF